MNDRERALHLLQRIERESLYASLVLQNEPGFVRTLVFGVLRWRSRLDFVITSLAGRRIEALDRTLVDVLRIGIYQLLFTDVAAYAAVSETVDLAGRHVRRARGMVNAILRRVSRGDVPDLPDVATRYAHPQWLIDRWTAMYGAERAEKIAEANQQLSFPDVLVLDGDPPPNATKSEMVDDVWKLGGSSAELDRDRFYPMDEGSAVIAAIAAATRNEVLDLAAAPGGKSLFMRKRGVRVISNDISITRLRLLAARGGAIVVSDASSAPFARRFPSVLLDAPCSATGTIRKNPELKWRLRERDLPSFAAVQRKLLRAALDLAGEFCIYSTCSLEAEENDEVVADAAASGFERIDLTRFAPPGVRSWVADGVLRLTPESGADGFTAFVLQRTVD